MIRAVALLISFACVFTASPTGAQEASSESFFADGLSGWVEMGDSGAFTAGDGVLELADPHNYPNWLRSPEQYENFVLELEYQTLGWAEGGIYLHAPSHGDPLKSGVKIHLRHDRVDEGARSTGALYDVQAPITFANNEDGWNALQVEMDWPRLRVSMNDVVVQDVDMERDPELRYRLRRGYLGFEDLGTRFRFRNVRVRELADAEPKWTSLFNGTDLSGWTSSGVAEWEARNGRIVGRGGDGVLEFEDSFSAYELQMYFRTTPHANGGIFYRRAERPGNDSHYEVQIYNVPTATNPTGSIYGIVPAIDAGCRSGEWCLLQLISDGPYSRVLINGRSVAVSRRLALPDSGRIALQHHSEGAVEYKEIRIKSLRR